MPRLSSKVAAITGASGGIGSAAASLFATEGASLALLDVDEAAGEALAARIRGEGGEAVFLRVDVTVEGQVREAISRAVGTLGALNVLVNCAGGSLADDAPVTEVDLSVWERTMSLDVLGTMLACRHAIPEMIRSGGGTIVNMSSWDALRGFNERHVYMAAKGAILSLTRGIAGEYSRRGVRANVICPGPILTERITRREADPSCAADPRHQARLRLREIYPFSVGAPRDVANIALFLASDESRMINGATIAADGGRSAF